MRGLRKSYDRAGWCRASHSVTTSSQMSTASTSTTVVFYIGGLSTCFLNLFGGSRAGAVICIGTTPEKPEKLLRGCNLLIAISLGVCCVALRCFGVISGSARFYLVFFSDLVVTSFTRVPCSDHRLRAYLRSPYRPPLSPVNRAANISPRNSCTSFSVVATSYCFPQFLHCRMP